MSLWYRGYRSAREDQTMTFYTDMVYNELRPYFQERVRRNEPLARHSAFGEGSTRR